MNIDVSVVGTADDIHQFLGHLKKAVPDIKFVNIDIHNFNHSGPNSNSINLILNISGGDKK